MNLPTQVEAVSRSLDVRPPNFQALQALKKVYMSGDRPANGKPDPVEKYYGLHFWSRVSRDMRGRALEECLRVITYY